MTTVNRIKNAAEQIRVRRIAVEAAKQASAVASQQLAETEQDLQSLAMIMGETFARVFADRFGEIIAALPKPEVIVHVAAPVVNVAAAVVPAAQVTVQAAAIPAPQVVIEPAKIEITVPSQEMVVDLDRDKDGKVTRLRKTAR